MSPILQPPPSGQGQDDVETDYEEVLVVSEEFSTGVDWVDEAVGLDEAFLEENTLSFMAIRTDSFDMGIRAMKFISWVELAMSESTDDVYVQLFYRNSKTSPWNDFGSRKVNSDGRVFIGLTAVEFQLRVWSNMGSGNNIDRIVIRWSLVDKRSIRGLYSGIQA